MRIVVIGASGFLGMNLIEAFERTDERPVCTYRGRVPRLSLRRKGVPTVPGDLDDPDTLRGAFDGAELVFHFAAHYPDLSIDREATMELGMTQLHNALDAAADAGVRRMVFLSSIASVAQNPDGGPATEEHTFDEPPGYGVYHDLKWEMEQVVLEESRFDTTILCPGACLGPWDMRIGTSAMAVGTARGKDVPHPDGWINVCDSRDVADFAIAISELDELPPRVLLSGGNYRLHDFLCMLAERYDVPPPPEPLDDGEAIERADEAERRAAEEGGRAELSRELVDLTIHGKRLDTSLATELTGLDYRPLDSTLDAFDTWARKKRIIPKQKASKEQPT